MNGAAVDMVNQYPAATATGIVRAAQLNPLNDQIAISAGNPLLIDILGGTSPNCRIAYTAATEDRLLHSLLWKLQGVKALRCARRYLLLSARILIYKENKNA
jgi:hypothetical protein